MRVGVVVAVGLLCPVAIASAQTSSFPVSGGVPVFSGTGTLQVSDTDGAYTITDISGPGVTELIQPGLFRGNDDELFPNSSTQLVDEQGFAFDDTMGNTSYQVRLFGDGSTGYLLDLLDSDGLLQTDMPVSFSLDTEPFSQPVGESTAAFSFSNAAAVTPEPSSIALLGTGLLGVAGLVRRRKR